MLTVSLYCHLLDLANDQYHQIILVKQGAAPLSDLVLPNMICFFMDVFKLEVAWDMPCHIHFQ